MAESVYEKRILYFVDILGFSAMVNKTRTTAKALGNLVDAAKLIHAHFNKPNQPWQGQIEVTQFSDSVVVGSSGKEDNNLIVMVFESIKYMQVRLL